MSLFALLLAFIAGVFMAIQGSLNTGLGKIIGLLESTFIVQIVGLATVLIPLYLLRLGKGDLSRFQDVPWYLYLGGSIGVIILYTVVASISQLGVATATTAIIVGQVGTAVLIDHFGFFGLEKIPFTWPKVAGLTLLAVGAKLMLLR